MSDRKNRDRGTKKAKKRVRWACNCWLCLSDSEKKRVKLEKQSRDRRYLGDVVDSLLAK